MEQCEQPLLLKKFEQLQHEYMNKAACYMWHKTEGEHGSSEIRACMFMYLPSRSDTDNVVLYCSQFPAMSLHTVENISMTDQKVTESGHSQME